MAVTSHSGARRRANRAGPAGVVDMGANMRADGRDASGQLTLRDVSRRMSPATSDRSSFS